MFWLALAAIGVAVGTGLKAWGDYEAQKAEKQKAENLRPVYAAQQDAIRAQQAQLAKDRENVQEIAGITRTQLAMQGTDIARQGAEVKGTLAARAGAGNVGGASVLRQAAYVQSKVNSQMAGIQLNQQKVDIQVESQLTSIATAEAGAAASMAQSKANEANNEIDIKLMNDFGWMGIAADITSGVTQIAALGAKVPTGGGAGSDWLSMTRTSPSTDVMTYPVPSLAVENFNYGLTYSPMIPGLGLPPTLGYL